jgi:hypothetical protein
MTTRQKIGTRTWGDDLLEQSRVAGVGLRTGPSRWATPATIETHDDLDQGILRLRDGGHVWRIHIDVTWH